MSASHGSGAVNDAAPELKFRRPGVPVDGADPLARRARARARRILSVASSPARGLPDWLIVGTQKGGTSSLWEYLSWHPAIRASERKEIDYFTWFYDRPLWWYRSYFGLDRGGRQTGEASPSYLYDPRVPERVARDLPGVRIIALLRDPVERAISHVHHERARGFEPLDVEAALAAEGSRLDHEKDHQVRSPDQASWALRHWSYVDRGLYAEQLERWLEHIPRGDLLILPSERLFDQTQEVYAQVLEFLRLASFAPAAFPAMNVNRYDGPRDALRERLRKRFAAPNERLFELLGERYPWPTASGGPGPGDGSKGLDQVLATQQRCLEP